jgi:SAM-dependent methyltransferase
MGNGESHLAPGLATRSTSFGRAAAQFDTYRVPPPQAAVEWLFPRPVESVIDVGAGTGALSRLLTRVASRVIAVEPDPDMRSVLASTVEGIEVATGTGEALPVPSRSVDAVVASSSWHWVEPRAGFTEAARVLRPGGLIAALWTGPDPEGTFMTQARTIVTRADATDPGLESTVSGELTTGFFTFDIPEGIPFSQPDHDAFRWIVPMTADQIIGMLGTLSWIIVMDEPDRRQLFATARRLLRDFLGVEGDVTVDVDYICQVYRSRLTELASSPTPGT